MKTNHLFLAISILYLSSFVWSCKAIQEMPQCEIVEKKYGNRSLNTQDSVTVVATTLYRGGLIKKMFQGRGYRKAWETPITVPMVRLDTLFGELEPIEKGGG